MANFRFMNYTEYENWIAVVVGLAVTVKGVQDLCHQILNLLQGEVCRVVSTQHLPDCNKNCSKRFRNNFIKWCTTCKQIKYELEKYNRYAGHWNHINWSKINTIDWKSDCVEIAKVFVNKIPDSSNMLEDLSSLISLFRNCDKFCIGDQVLFDVLMVRNRYYAHYFELRLSEYEKHRCLDSLISLLKDQTVSVTTSAKWAIDILQRVKTTTDINQDILDDTTRERALLLLQIQTRNVEDMNNEELHISDYNRRNSTQVQNLHQGVDYIRRRMTTFHTSGSQRLTKSECCSIKTICLMVTSTAIALFSILLAIAYQTKYPGKLVPGRKEECMSMYFKDFGASDWDFIYDVRSIFNHTVIERKWLKEVIENELEKSEHGVLLTADMGFGKSSVVAAIVCSGDDFVWYDFKQVLLSYHMCKYDVEMSKEPTVFIRNIAAMLSTRYEWFYQTLRSDNTTDYFLYGAHCSKDPVGCFDRLVVRPLQQNLETFRNEHFIIVLDAADECEYVNGKTDIVSILSHRLAHVPTQIKFLVTSRDTSSIKNKLTELNSLSVSSYHEDIKDDLKSYIDMKTEQNKLLRARLNVQDLVTYANGSLLYLAFYLKNCQQSDSCSTDEVPVSITQLYLNNFKREFGFKGEYFKYARVLFELLVASKRPLMFDALMNLSNVSIMDDESVPMFFKNKLRQFLHFSQLGYTLIHISLADFLVDLTKDSPYYINIKRGHERLGHYYLKRPFTNGEDLIGVAFHVARSENATLEKEFITSARQMKLNKTKNFLLHTAAQTLNSYHTMDLLNQIIVEYNMDLRDGRNETAAFLAASYDNFDSLEWLLDNGGDINFEKNREEYKSLSKFDLVKECKYVYFCGYNLLEISAQNGHYQTVKNLLKKDVNLLNHETSFGSTAFDLAAENGHENILHLMTKLNKSLPRLHSLYKAAENGHAHVVSLLQSKGIQDKCVTCTNDLYWLSDDEQRSQQEWFQVRTVFEESKKVFHDDWRLIICESALHAAVRNCHIDIIDILINQNTSAMHCFDRFGRTPIMASVVYSCSIALQMLFKRGANTSERCNDVYNFSRSNLLLSKKENKIYIENRCPKGWTLSHLLQKHDHWDIIKFLLGNGYKQWNDPDDEGVTPLHYAHCDGGERFMALAISEKFRFMFSLSKSENGSTPHHAAAFCKNLIGHIAHYRPEWLKPKGSVLLHKFFNDGVPDVRDNDGRSLMHYFFLGKMIDSGTATTFIDLYFDINIDMTAVDIHGRNFMHYAMQWAQMNIITYILHKMMLTEKEKLLSQKDKDDRTPLEVSFNHLSFDNHISKFDKRRLSLTLPDCRFSEIFSDSCIQNNSLLLTKRELFNLHLLSIYYQMNISGVNVTDLVYVAANRSSFYSLLMLRIVYPQQYLQILSDRRHVYNLFQMYQGVYMAYILFPSENILICNESHTKNALASIIMNYEDGFWLYYVNYDFLNFYLKDKDNQDLDNCFDKEGYNLLHRAAMGGNFIALRYLIDKGMDIFTLSSSNETLIEIIFKNALYKPTSLFHQSFRNRDTSLEIIVIHATNHKTLVHMNPSFEAPDYDSSAQYILTRLNMKNENDKIYWRKVLCHTNKITLSLVHLAAAKGLLTSLKAIYDQLGRSVIICQNYHSITPFYLAKINDHFGIVNWIQTLDVKIVYPQKRLMPVIAYLFAVNFDPIVKMPRICRWSLMKNVNLLTKNNYINCFGIYTKSIKSTIYLPYLYPFRTKEIFNIFYLWVNLLRRYSYHARKLKHMVHEVCYKKYDGKKCSRITFEVSLQFKGATIASHMLYQSLKLFHGNHITQMTSYMFMYNMTYIKDVHIPTLSSLYYTVFSGKVEYLKSLKMTERQYNAWSLSKIGHIEAYGDFSSFDAELNVKRQNNKFTNDLFDYFNHFQFLMRKQIYSALLRYK